MTFLKMSSEYPNQQPRREADTYRVGISEGVLIRKTRKTKYVMTEGLRTCVGFALISPNDGMALLVHFFSLEQVENSLNTVFNAFMSKLSNRETPIECAIIGARFGVYNSEKMVEDIQKFVYQNLTSPISLLKMNVQAPIVGADSETLGCQINLFSGECNVFMNKTGESESSSFDETDSITAKAPEKKIQFTNFLR